MKFIRLEMLNLASLDRQGGEVIDFEEGALGESTIFSIVGPTGSGKSTILDAICLALYNRAPRYPRMKGEKKQSIEIFGGAEGDEKNRLAPTDCRNILTRGKKEGYSKLTFQANNGFIYRAEWYVRMKTKNYDDVITSLYRITEKDGVLTEEPEEWDNLLKIIGLDYDQFLRTVLIAQGSFANFLKAKENERYELLEKLIGCEELYASIAAKIKAQRDDAVEAYNEVAANFTAFEKDLIPEEELSALQTRLAELEALDKQAKAELLKVTEALAWYITNEKHQENLAIYEQAFRKAKEQLDAMREKADRLALHDATLPALELYRDMKNAQAQAAQLGQALQSFYALITKQEEEIEKEEKVNLAKLQQALLTAAHALEQQKPHINKAREIKTVLAELKKVLKEKTTAQDDAANALEKAEKELAANEKAIGKAAQDLQKYAQETQRLQGTIEQEKAVRNEALAKIEAQIADVQGKIANTDIEQLNADVEALLRTYTLMTSEKWEAHRALLKEGEPCPLCGGTHHPYRDKAVSAQVENELGIRLRQKQQEQKDYNQNKLLLDQLNTQKDKASKAILTYAEYAQQQQAAQERQVMAAHTQLETEKGKTANLKAQQAEKAQALKAAAEALRTAAADVAAKTDALRQELGGNDPDTLEQQLETAKSSADQSVKAKTEQIARLREQLNEVKGKETATKNQKETAEQSGESKNKALAAWLSHYNEQTESQQITLADIAALYTAPDRWEDIRTQQRNLSAACTSAETTFQNETKAYAQHQAQQPEQAKDALLTRKAELEQHSTKELVDVSTLLQRHEQAKQQMGALFEQKEAAETLKKEWEQITEAIGGDGKTLRKIAQCYTLRFLVAHANAEIRKFSSRYELVHVKNSLGMRVIDHDRADDVREVTSLSGGETFIVSLGLALGLSALSSRNISFQNLFIDEGFGTLDPDTLATVIDSLAMLQTSQGKKVGVISHTDTMSERITTQIRIIKNGNSGSSHIEIYP